MKKSIVAMGQNFRRWRHCFLIKYLRDEKKKLKEEVRKGTKGKKKKNGKERVLLSGTIVFFIYKVLLFAL